MGPRAVSQERSAAQENHRSYIPILSRAVQIRGYTDDDFNCDGRLQDEVRIEVARTSFIHCCPTPFPFLTGTLTAPAQFNT